MWDIYRRNHGIVHLLVVSSLAFAVYSNNYRHDFHLDSAMSIAENSYVRSLKHIPTYFRDPKTLTSYRGNADYRPVLQITYALNYQVSGYDTWSWHLVQILLHLICAWSLYLLCCHLIRRFEPEADPTGTATIAFLVALLFVVHPTASGVVNYLHARSSLLVAALLLPSVVLYLRRPATPDSARTPWLAVLLYTLALWSKVEAVACLAVYLLADTLQTAHTRMSDAEPDPGRPVRAGFLADLRRTCTRRTLTRLAPFLAVTAGYLLVRALVVEDYVAEARHEVGAWTYLCTQVTAWWHYVLRWLAPVSLVADDQTFPVQRSLGAPVVLLALAALAVLGAALGVLYRRRPHYTFLALSALALLSPTSSIVPLAEMVNEHRPYLPLALLSMIGTVPALRFLLTRRETHPSARATAAGALLLLIVALSALTITRNRDFSTSERYYEDILRKAPGARAHLNYGRLQLEKGRLELALSHLRQALATAPGWHIVHINLGVAYQRLQRYREAEWHFDAAVRTDRFTGLSREFRGYYRLYRNSYALALEDLREGQRLCRECYRVSMALATAYAGLGDWERSLAHMRECRKLDARRTELDMTTITGPFWESSARYAAGFRFYLALDGELPGRWWVKQNLSDLALKLGRNVEAERYRQDAVSLRRASP